ncbi:peptidyl-tRNA hydrolase [Thalassospira xiamenensis]|uniref:peptidyl-tRNA hydrolase n=1 Tax=Thalassospira xiamenensis TaxID=220697 RepID=UPI0032C3ED6C
MKETRFEPAQHDAATPTTLSSEASFTDYFTFIIERADLKMSRGKLAAQCAHACRLSFLSFLNKSPGTIPSEADSSAFGSIVVLKAKSELQLKKLFELAQERDLPTHLFTDHGHVISGTVFDGQPVLTALAIGPVQRARIDDATRAFSCA